MDIGTGIAVAGIWMLPVAATVSKTATELSWWFSVILACTATGIMMVDG